MEIATNSPVTIVPSSIAPSDANAAARPATTSITLDPTISGQLSISNVNPIQSVLLTRGQSEIILLSA